VTKTRDETRKQYERDWKAANAAKCREYRANWLAKQEPGYEEKRKEKYRNENRELLRKKATEYNRTHTEQHKKTGKKIRDELKKQTMNAYDGKCACCGETELAFLTIDHILNNGATHRRELREEHGKSFFGGTRFYHWLRDNNYPQEEYQCLCSNCNLGKRINDGICPHQQKKSDREAI